MNGLIVDSFAGGGGASTGIETALGRPVDIAINHDAEAIAMHAINHPRTRHYQSNVWDVDPVEACGRNPVELMWLSPDCTYHSKARGGKPHRHRDPARRRRGLAWVAVRWAKAVRPRVIALENVEEFADWGPLDDSGRPCPLRRGLTFRRFVRSLENVGYTVDWRELRACDYGAPTIRKRLFLVARCDGLPIAWPDSTHAPPDHPAVLAGRMSPWRTAAECIDWSIPCPSIFERERPLAEATQRRIAAGIRRFVLDAADPFIVPITHTTAGDRAHAIDEPLLTITTAKGGELALVAPTLIQTGYGEREGQAPRVPGLHKPLGTVVDGQKHALVAAFLAKHYGGNETPGWPVSSPISTLTTQDHHHLVTSHLLKLHGSSRVGQSMDEPTPTIRAQGTHLAEVRAFLCKFYGNDRHGAGLREPTPTVTTKDRLGLVTVAGDEYAIVDIGMRMLQPRELFTAQGFPADYIIEFEHDGRPLPKTAQVRMCGNSVAPPVVTALVRANVLGVEHRSAA